MDRIVIDSLNLIFSSFVISVWASVELKRMTVSLRLSLTPLNQSCVVKIGFFAERCKLVFAASFFMGGDTSRTFKKLKIFFFAQIDWKTIQKYNPKVLLVTRKLNGTYFFMYRNFEARFLETNFFIRPLRLRANYSTDLLE